MSDLKQIQQKLQNLIDLKGQDIELVGPDLLDEIENLFDSQQSEITDLQERNSSLNSELEDLKEEGEQFESDHTIDTGLDKITWRLDRDNLQDTQVMEALGECYGKGVKPLLIAGVLEGLSKN